MTSVGSKQINRYRKEVKTANNETGVREVVPLNCSNLMLSAFETWTGRRGLCVPEEGGGVKDLILALVSREEQRRPVGLTGRSPAPHPEAESTHS